MIDWLKETLTKLDNYMRRESVSNAIAIGMLGLICIYLLASDEPEEGVDLIRQLSLLGVLFISLLVTLNVIYIFQKWVSKSTPTRPEKWSFSYGMLLAAVFCFSTVLIFSGFSRTIIIAIVAGVWFAVCLKVFELVKWIFQKARTDLQKRFDKRTFDRLNERPENRRNQ